MVHTSSLRIAVVGSSLAFILRLDKCKALASDLTYVFVFNQYCIDKLFLLCYSLIVFRVNTNKFLKGVGHNDELYERKN